MSFISKVKSFFQDVSKYTLVNSLNRISYKKSTGDYLKYNEVSLYVNKAIDKRAEKVSEVQFVLKDGKGKVIEKAPVLDLLNKPNPYHTGKQFWKLFQKYLDLTGVAYILLENKKELFDLKTITAMWLLRPDLVEAVWNEDGTIKEYKYKKDGTTTVTYKPEQIIRAIEPDPMNPREGASLIKSGIRAIETEIQLAEYQANILANGGKIEGIFKFKNDLTRTQIEEMKEKYVDDLASARKAGRPLFLGGDADYVNTSLNPTELAFLESKKTTLNDICILTGVPKAILASVGDETFTNADASISIFLRETIKPLLENLANFLDWRLVPEEYELTFIDPTPENIDVKVKIINALYATDASSINERRAIFNLEPSTEPDADKIFVSFAKTPLGEKKATPLFESKSITKSPACRMSDETKDECVSRKIPELIDEGMPQDQAVAVANKLCSVSCEQKDFKHPLRDKAVRDQYRIKQLSKQDRREAIMVGVMRDYFNGQEKRITENLTGIKKWRQKELFDEIFDRNLEIRIAKGAVLPFLRNIMKEAGTDATELLNYDFGFNFSSTVEKWLDDRTDIFAQQITMTTYDKMKDAFSQSIEEGENRNQLVKRIQEVYSGFDENRARTIARTEVHGAVQRATLEGYKQAGSPIKIWVAILDDDTRDSHAYLDGEERPINVPFSNGLQYPGDSRGEAREIINCRCSA